jgi:hypothetical protein
LMQIDAHHPPAVDADGVQFEMGDEVGQCLHTG